MNQSARLTSDEIRRLCGDIDSETVAEIAATGATLAELEEALAYIAGDDDVMGKSARPLVGRVAAVYDILTSEEDELDLR